MMANPPSNSRAKPQSGSSDFTSPEDYLSKDDYDLKIAPIVKRITALENRVKDHTSLAKSFKEAFENDKNMDKVLVTLLVELIQKDDDFKKAVEKAVRKSDREWLNARLKSIWAFVIAVLLLIIGAVLDHYLVKK
jgi:hypothetical protein